MNTFLRALIVWLVLLAVPFQGFASAAMLACGSGHGGPAAPDAPHAHTAVNTTPHAAPHADPHADPHDMPGHDHASMPQAGHDGQDAPGHGKAHACSACSACSIGAAIAPASLPALAVHAAPLPSVPFADGHVPSVHLALPERPPRPIFA